VTEALRIYEVGLRDGLQNEREHISLTDKRRLLEGAIRAGLRTLELTSFVSLRAVPQMADAADMVDAARNYTGAGFTTLIVNDKGYERALAAESRGIAIVVVVTETLCRSNNRMTVAQSIATAARLLHRARWDGLYTRVYIAPAWVCPFEGQVPPERVLECADALASAGFDELAIADTIGHAHPRQVADLFDRLGGLLGGTDKLAAHLHDTQAMGLANAAAAIAAGVRTIDSSFGGLGGCPFAPGAAGNLATEDLVLMADKMGFDTGVDLAELWNLVGTAEDIVGRRLGCRSRAWWETTLRDAPAKERAL
jgi:hydroxymethylglutaryl-CoA lyase